MKIILTGATGYVGEGTLLELLKVDAVEKVLSVSRKSTGIKHEKLEEYLVSDFMQLKEGDEHFKGYDAVFFIARSRQLHIYRNGKKVLVLAGKAAPKIIREDDRICKLVTKE